MVNYNIADLVSRINNSYRTGKNHIILPYSKDSYQIIILLTKLGILNINSPERALLAGSSPALDPDEAVI
jgi:ribosomal protein S8